MMQAREGGRSSEFAQYLKGFVDRTDRSALAALRRGLGKRPGEAAEVFPYLAVWNIKPWQEETYYLVASLFALHQLSWLDGDGDRNLGASLAQMRSKTESGSIEKRLVALLDADREDLPNHLRRTVSLLKAHEIPIDWAQLIDDLDGWNWESRSVQRRWARAFWGRQRAAASEEMALAVGGFSEETA